MAVVSEHIVRHIMHNHEGWLGLRVPEGADAAILTVIGCVGAVPPCQGKRARMLHDY
jgi:hypothetical protein